MDLEVQEIKKATRKHKCSVCDNAICETDKKDQRLFIESIAGKECEVFCTIKGEDRTNKYGTDCINWLARFPKYEKKKMWKMSIFVDE